MREFDSIAHFSSDREIDELPAAIDARREVRTIRPDAPPKARMSRHEPKPDEPGSGPRRVVEA